MDINVMLTVKELRGIYFSLSPEERENLEDIIINKAIEEREQKKQTSITRNVP